MNEEGPTCGLIPVNGACTSVTTSGLKWNLSGGALELGVFISSSNSLDRSNPSIVTVNNDGMGLDVNSDLATDDRMNNHSMCTAVVEVETDNYLLWSITLGG